MFCVLVHTCSLQKTAIIAHTNGGITHSIVVKLISHGPHSACVIFRRRRRLTKGEMLSLICACSSVCVRIFLKRKMARRRRQNKRPRILHARAKWRQSVRITHTHTHTLAARRKKKWQSAKVWENTRRSVGTFILFNTSGTGRGLLSAYICM
jgi:hypothetical protein